MADEAAPLKLHTSRMIGGRAAGQSIYGWVPIEMAALGGSRRANCMIAREQQTS